MLASSMAHASGPRRDVVVLRSSEQSIQIEFTPEYKAPQAMTLGGKEFVHYDFKGSTPLASEKETGVPDLRYKILTLGFQSTQGNAVQVLAADYEDIPNVAIRPIPSLEVKDGFLTAKEYLTNTESYNLNSFSPATVAELSPVRQSRSMLIGNVNVYPLQYNPATKMLRRYSKIVVEVVFGTSSAPRINNDDDELLGPILLNAKESRAWKFGIPRALGKVTGQPSVLASGTWYRFEVANEGMYMLDANWFSANGISLSGVDPRTIKIYGNGGEELPESPLASRPIDLVENTIQVVGEADGQFNPGDYVVFYGRGVQGTKYDPVGKTMRHYIHHYSRVNYYWLTFGGAPGKRMATQPSVAGGNAFVPTKYLDAVWVEPDTVNLLKSGKTWLSSPINPGGSQVRTFTLHGVIPTEPRTYRYRLAYAASNGATYRVREGNTQIASHSVFGGGGDVAVAEASAYETTGSFPLSGTTSQVGFDFTAGNASSTGWLDWLEIIYSRTLDPVNNALRFRAPDTTALVEYRLGQFSSTSSVYNVTRHDSVRRVDATAGSFRANEQAGQVSEYFAVASGAYQSPTGVTRIDPQNLRGIVQQYDFIIVTSQEFRSAADRLKQHRENPAYGGLKTIVVDVKQIYNEFGGGVTDISAIRDFLKYAYDNWFPSSPPKFVCFFGQASYDYKGIFGKSSYVPTWEGGPEFDDIRSTATDDFFVRFGPLPNPDMVSGRINARSNRQAETIVDKLIAYDTQSSSDPWKLRGLFVGDDGWVPNGDDFSEHTRGAEEVAARTPDIFEKRKVYIEEYPTVQTAQGRRKPGAYQDIIDEINRGVLLVNFTGHGNPTVWAHESVFSTQTSIPQLFNRDKLTVFFGATCNFSQFDDAGRETGSELLMNRTEGGAIGVVSASRKVYSAQNHALNNGIYERMFFVDRFGRTSAERVATAIYRFKNELHNDDNDEKYFWMGDPTMRLQFPRSYSVIEKINQVPVDSLNGLPRTSPIQLKSLARVTIEGSIRDAENRIDSSYNGRLTLEVNDAARSITIPAWNLVYRTTGSLIYRGDNSITKGRFSSTFIVPKDIAYADSTTRGRLVAYVTGTASDGAGYTSNIWVGGTDSSARNDTEGPSIKVALGNSYEGSLSFRPGDVVNEKPILYIDLFDSSGINTSTSGIGHRIEAWINNSPDSKDMTEFYTSTLDNFRSGRVTYQLRDLSQGRNSIRVRAWDTYNNARSAETFFEVMSSDQLRIVEVMNFPNPVAKSTAFTFKHNQSIPVKTTIKIYTVAGRLIQTLEKPSASDQFVSIPWDGRDRDGDVLANGVYLYKVLVQTVDGRFSSEVLDKLAIAK